MLSLTTFHARPRWLQIIAVTTVFTLQVPAHASAAPRSRLVDCGGETCLRIDGRRADPADVVSVGGSVVAVSGGRDWRIVVPLAEARAWSARSTTTLAVETAAADGTTVETQDVALPPGAFGRHVELISMIVGGR